MSIYLEKKMSVPELFIPPDVKVQECIESEEAMIACSKFFLNIMKQTNKALEKNELLKFDANAADFGCEKQMLTIISLFNSEVKNECIERSKEAEKILIEISNRQNAKTKNSPEKFFEEKIGSIKISAGMGYLLRAFMLTVSKKVTKDGGFRNLY